MNVQWYFDESQACIFQQNCLLAEIPNCLTVHIADDRLRALGWRRRQKWQKRDWGFEAEIRRILK